ncbi:MAG: CHAP domain-containing protein, partial [bacterium]|nr:CHAP domain-containing protein [bacterium]
GNTAVYGYNGYVPGYCTWYVANKRMQIGRPVPANLGNASTWDNYAPQGWDRTPRAGAAVVTAEGGAGHVAFVEKVNSDGSVLLSEMNRRRLYEVTTRVISPSEAGLYKYIH